MTHREQLDTLPDPDLPIIVTRAGAWEGKVGTIEIVAALGAYYVRMSCGTLICLHAEDFRTVLPS